MVQIKKKIKRLDRLSGKAHTIFNSALKLLNLLNLNRRQTMNSNQQIHPDTIKLQVLRAHMIETHRVSMIFVKVLLGLTVAMSITLAFIYAAI